MKIKTNICSSGLSVYYNEVISTENNNSSSSTNNIWKRKSESLRPLLVVSGKVMTGKPQSCVQEGKNSNDQKLQMRETVLTNLFLHISWTSLRICTLNSCTMNLFV